MNETNTGRMPADTKAEALAALATPPFDPAELLGGKRAPLPYAAGPTPEPVRTFDPAAYLGDAARRGPAMIGDGRPLTARIGGVEVVTIPLEHYAALLSPLSLARPGVSAGSGTPDPEGMFLLLLSLHAEGVLSIGQLAQATGLDHLDLGDRIAGYAGLRPKQWHADGMEGGVITGQTDDGRLFSMEPVRDPHDLSPEQSAILATSPEPVAPVEFVATPEEARVELPPDPADMPVTAEEQAAAYDTAAARGDVAGSAIDAKGNPAEPTGKGVTAYDAERGSVGRRRSRR